jgi:threonine dehydrogenase-like Zn-dependent dehydrogenase
VGGVNAIVLHGPGRVSVAARPEPRVEQPGDAVVRAHLAGICGSDLHIVSGRDAGCRPGTIMGHELVGTVETVGPGVRSLRPGDRVVAPFTASCGACYFCRRGLTGRCVESVGLGFVTDAGRGLEGAQAERVRIPLADTTLVRLPDRHDDGTPFTDVDGLFLGDILSTAYSAAEAAAIEPGAVVAVVGCGPVGLLAVQAALVLGAGAVVAVDALGYRRDKARAFGAAPAAPADAAAAVAERSEGRGADAVVEAVGAAPALDLAIALARPGATISIAGYHTDASYPFPIERAYGKNLTVRIGRCHARAVIDRLLPHVRARRFRQAEIVTHVLPLGDGARGYEIFTERRDGAIKVLLDCSG